MSRLYRPYIPLSIREQVIDRQLREADVQEPRFTKYHGSAATRIAGKIAALFGENKVELHHRPALVNRTRKRSGKYLPDANDENFLVYLPEDEHDIETRVRGQHGQHSDLALVRKRKRKERKAKRRKTKWPSRALRSANRWLKGRAPRSKNR
jgi:hypothetical protein